MAWQQLSIIQCLYVVNVSLSPLFCGDVVAMLHPAVFSLPDRKHTRLTPITAAAAGDPAIDIADPGVASGLRRNRKRNHREQVQYRPVDSGIHLSRVSSLGNPGMLAHR